MNPAGIHVIMNFISFFQITLLRVAVVFPLLAIPSVQSTKGKAHARPALAIPYGGGTGVGV